VKEKSKKTTVRKAEEPETYYNKPVSFNDVWYMFQETDKKFQKLEGFFSSQWGRFVESLVEGDLVRLLNKRHIIVSQTFTNAKFFFKGKEYEFDIIAANGNEVVVVEVKTNLKIEDVRYFMEKLSMFRSVFHQYDNYKVYAAIAYLKCHEEADKYSYRQGLFVIKATGRSAIITNDGSFVPKIF
jgi:predicted AAA+ superfamily ATPase